MRFLLAVRLLLGLALLLPGLQKAGHPTEFAQMLANYRMLPPFLEAPLAFAVPRLEIGVGLCLLSGLLLRPAAALSGGLALGFTVFVGSALARGLDITCGCFSGAARVSWAHLVFDLALLGGSLALLRWGADRWCGERRGSEKRRRFAGAVGAVLLLGSFLLVPAPRPVSPSAVPALLFDPPRLDLGAVRPGQKVERTVRYQNIGSERLDIHWVQASCRCTVPRPSKQTLASGESGELSVVYQARAGESKPRQSVKVYQRGRTVPAVLEVEAQLVDEAR